MDNALGGWPECGFTVMFRIQFASPTGYVALLYIAMQTNLLKLGFKNEMISS